MEKRSEAEKSKLLGANEAEELDALNADVRTGPSPSQKIRRKIEATIESKARKRRKSEKPASAAFKK